MCSNKMAMAIPHFVALLVSAGFTAASIDTTAPICHIDHGRH